MNMNNGFRTYNAIPEGRATIKPGRSTEAEQEKKLLR